MLPGIFTHRDVLWTGGADQPCAAFTPLYSINSGASPTSNRAQYVPIIVRTPVVVTQLLLGSGGAASGNIDIGIYNSDTLARIVNSGSTAMALANEIQIFNITDTPLSPGRYWIAVQFSGTQSVYNWAPSEFIGRLVGSAMENVGSFGLPATATPAAVSSPYIPFVGAQIARAA